MEGCYAYSGDQKPTHDLGDVPDGRSYRLLVHYKLDAAGGQYLPC